MDLAALLLKIRGVWSAVDGTKAISTLVVHSALWKRKAHVKQGENQARRPEWLPEAVDLEGGRRMIADCVQEYNTRRLYSFIWSYESISSRKSASQGQARR